MFAGTDPSVEDEFQKILAEDARYSARLWKAQGNHKKARECFRKAVEIDVKLGRKQRVRRKNRTVAELLGEKTPG